MHDHELAKRLYSDQSDSAAKNSSALSLASEPLDCCPDGYGQAVTVKLWDKMRARFGQRWSRDYGEASDPIRAEWQGNLGLFTAQEVAGAISLMDGWESPHPPTYPEFRALCLSARAKLRPNWTQERVAREVPLAQLTAPKRGDSEVARQEKDRIRRISSGEDVETKAESWRKLHLDRLRGPLPA